MTDLAVLIRQIQGLIRPVSGNPEGAVSAPPGTIACNRANGKVYKKNAGTGNTGWLELAAGGSGYSPPIPQSDVTDLVTDLSALSTALAGKAPTVHTHDQADVTGLTDALDEKAPLDNPAFTGFTTAEWLIVDNDGAGGGGNIQFGQSSIDSVTDFSTFENISLLLGGLGGGMLIAGDLANGTGTIGFDYPVNFAGAIAAYAMHGRIDLAGSVYNLDPADPPTILIIDQTTTTINLGKIGDTQPIGDFNSDRHVNVLIVVQCDPATFSYCRINPYSANTGGNTNTIHNRMNTKGKTSGAGIWNLSAAAPDGDYYDITAANAIHLLMSSAKKDGTVAGHKGSWNIGQLGVVG